MRGLNYNCGQPARGGDEAVEHSTEDGWTGRFGDGDIPFTLVMFEIAFANQDS